MDIKNGENIQKINILEIDKKKSKKNFIIFLSAFLIILSLILILIPLIVRIKQEIELKPKENYNGNNTNNLDAKKPDSKPTYDADGKVTIDIPAKDLTSINPSYGSSAGGIQNLTGSTNIISNPTSTDLLHGINNSKFLDTNGNILSSSAIKVNPSVISYFDSNGNGKFDIGIDYALNTNELDFMNKIGSNLNSTFTSSAVPISDFTIINGSVNTSVKDLLNTGLLNSQDITSSTKFTLNGYNLSNYSSSNQAPANILQNEILSNKYQDFSNSIDRYYNDTISYNAYNNSFSDPLTKNEVNTLDNSIRNSSNKNLSAIDQTVEAIQNKNSADLTAKINTNAISGFDKVRLELKGSETLFANSGMTKSNQFVTTEIANVDELKGSLNDSIATGSSAVLPSSQIFDSALTKSLYENAKQSYQYNQDYLSSNVDISKIDYPTEFIHSDVYSNLPKEYFKNPNDISTNVIRINDMKNYLKDNQLYDNRYYSMNGDSLLNTKVIKSL